MKFQGMRAAVAIGAVLVAFPAAAAFAADGVSAQNAWARASAGPMKAGAAFVELRNDGAADDALVAADAPVAATVELHTHISENGVMKMRRVERIGVPAHGETKLQPGGLHVMLIGLHAPLAEGQKFDMTLRFEKAGTIVVPVTVRGAAAR